jgi:phage shock protein C
MICPTCNSEIQPSARFCSACGQRVAPAYAPVYTPIHDAAAREGLVRPREGRAIAGVCRGFANRYGWDVVIVRLVLVLAVLVGAGTPFLAYIIAWIVMPNGPWLMPMQAEPAPPVAPTQPQA